MLQRIRFLRCPEFTGEWCYICEVDVCMSVQQYPKELRERATRLAFWKHGKTQN